MPKQLVGGIRAKEEGRVNLRVVVADSTHDWLLAYKAEQEKRLKRPVSLQVILHDLILGLVDGRNAA